jgi:hypothetical protein
MSAPKIPDGPDGRLVRAAFAALNLDPNNPDRWFPLILGYVEASRKRAKAGAPKKWTDDKLMQLLMDFTAQQQKMQQTNPNVSENSICAQLVKRETYRKFKPNTLRKKLYDARNPERNLIVGPIIKWIRTAPRPVDQSDWRRRPDLMIVKRVVAK